MATKQSSSRILQANARDGVCFFLQLRSRRDFDVTRQASVFLYDNDLVLCFIFQTTSTGDGMMDWFKEKTLQSYVLYFLTRTRRRLLTSLNHALSTEYYVVVHT